MMTRSVIDQLELQLIGIHTLDGIYCHVELFRMLGIEKPLLKFRILQRL